jgi:hypothetical protein
LAADRQEESSRWQLIQITQLSRETSRGADFADSEQAKKHPGAAPQQAPGPHLKCHGGWVTMARLCWEMEAYRNLSVT